MRNDCIGLGPTVDEPVELKLGCVNETHSEISLALAGRAGILATVQSLYLNWLGQIG
jgi:hypothetical protein